MEGDDDNREQEVIHEILLSDIVAVSELSLLIEAPNNENEERSVDERKSVIRVA